MANKKVTKKESVKSKETSKKTSEKKKKLIDNLIPKTTGEKILLFFFISLLAIVIILIFKVVALKQETTKEDTNLTIPLLSNKINNTFSVDLEELSKDEITEYKFKITNYKEDTISKEDIEYKLNLTKNSDAVSIKLYKNGSDENLLTEDTDNFVIDDNTLEKNEKNEDTYYLIIRVKEEVEKKDNIEIKITGIN